MDYKYKGMTVNERLYVSGLMEAFDEAVRVNDSEEVSKILKKVEITDEAAIEAILKDLGLIHKI